MRIDAWLRCTWALVPGRCPDCGHPDGVIAYAEDGDDKPWRWSDWCLTCSDPRGEGPETRIRDGVRWLIGEVRPRVATVPGPMERLYGPGFDVVIWQRADTTIPAAHVIDIMHGFKALAHARLTYAEKPGEWALALREDGTLWAPWCPIAHPWQPRSGTPLPYKEVTLGTARQTRICAACLEPLANGARAWRPYNPGSTLGSAGWPSDAHQRACVCEPCAKAAIARGIPSGPDIVYGHLRLVGGVESRDPASG